MTATRRRNCRSVGTAVTLLAFLGAAPCAQAQSVPQTQPIQMIKVLNAYVPLINQAPPGGPNSINTLPAPSTVSVPAVTAPPNHKPPPTVTTATPPPVVAATPVTPTTPPRMPERPGMFTNLPGDLRGISGLAQIGSINSLISAPVGLGLSLPRQARPNMLENRPSIPLAVPSPLGATDAVGALENAASLL